MPKNLFIFNFKKFPWGLIICLLLFGISEFFLQSFGYTLLRPVDIMFIQKKKILEGKRALKCDVLILGDSRVNFLDAEELGRAISAALQKDFSVYNASLPYQDIRGYYLILKHYLKKHRKPKAIFFSSMPESVFDGWNINGAMPLRGNYIHRFCLLFSLKDSFDVFPPDIFREIMFWEIERYSFIVTFRGYWRSSLEKRFRLRGNFQEALKGTDRWEQAKLKEKDPDFVQRRLIHQIKTASYYNHTNLVNKESFFWLNQFLALADKESIPILLFNAPILDIYFSQREKNGFHNRYREMIEKIIQSYDNVTILYPLVQGYGLKYFRDNNHLNEEGQRIFEVQIKPEFIHFLKTEEKDPPPI